jgi:dihydrofolate reductase
MDIIGILAVNRVGCIGRGNSIPWDVKEDREFFRRTTSCQTVIMGRKTYQSLEKVYGLKDRNNIVLATNSVGNTCRENNTTITFVDQVTKAIKVATKMYTDFGDRVFVVGGAKVYMEFKNLITKWYITYVRNEVLGDTYFPYMYTEEFHNKFQGILLEQHELCTMFLYNRIDT